MCAAGKFKGNNLSSIYKSPTFLFYFILIHIFIETYFVFCWWTSTCRCIFGDLYKYLRLLAYHRRLRRVFSNVSVALSSASRHSHSIGLIVVVLIKRRRQSKIDIRKPLVHNVHMLHKTTEILVYSRAVILSRPMMTSSNYFPSLYFRFVYFFSYLCFVYISII